MSSCAHDVTEIRRIRRRTGSQFRCQCLSCGQPVSRPIPLKRVAHPGAVSQWDDALERRHAPRSRGNSRRRAYDRYLRSKRWRQLKRLVLERDGYVCQAPDCGSPDGLEVHHRTYERFGNERLEDLVTLCAACHGALEGTVA